MPSTDIDVEDDEQWTTDLSGVRDGSFVRVRQKAPFMERWLLARVIGVPGPSGIVTVAGPVGSGGIDTSPWVIDVGSRPGDELQSLKVREVSGAEYARTPSIMCPACGGPITWHRGGRTSVNSLVRVTVAGRRPTIARVTGSWEEDGTGHLCIEVVLYDTGRVLVIDLVDGTPVVEYPVCSPEPVTTASTPPPADDDEDDQLVVSLSNGDTTLVVADYWEVTSGRRPNRLKLWQVALSDDDDATRTLVAEFPEGGWRSVGHRLAIL